MEIEEKFSQNARNMRKGVKPEIGVGKGRKTGKKGPEKRRCVVSYGCGVCSTY